MSRYIRHRPNSCTHTRGLQRQGQGTYATVPNAPMARPAKRVSLLSSQFSEAFLVTTRPCLLKNQIMPQSSCVQTIANYHCVPLFMKLLIIIIYDHLYTSAIARAAVRWIDHEYQ